MINTVGEINKAALEPLKLIKIAEEQYIEEIYKTAQKIADNNAKPPQRISFASAWRN